jgi:hypothetical protein
MNSELHRTCKEAAAVSVWSIVHTGGTGDAYE